LSLVPTFTATRYVQPLREGGSLPAVVDTDGGRFVVKFRGAGHGARALIAELIVGMMARELDLATPELALITVPPQFGRSEPDAEIQDLLRASHGVNVGLRYLDGAFNFELSAARDLVSPEFATRLVWLDALVTNPDRTHKNPNLLVWERQPWLIDHGAALYAHHDWPNVDERRTRSPFPLIRDHVLLGETGDLEAADAECAARLTDAVLERVLGAVPDLLLMDPAGEREFASAELARARYVGYLRERLKAPRAFVSAAIAARTAVRSSEPHHLSARR
jgi:hypothetical protein